MTQRYSSVERAYLGAVSAVMRRTMFIPPQRHFHRTFATRVVSVTRSAPRVRRLTLKGVGLEDLDMTGPDEYCGLLMAPQGHELVLPPGNKLNPRSELAKIPPEKRPELRWYTIRRHRPEVGEVDIDIVEHQEGPGEQFMRRVMVGDGVGFREGVASYQPLPGRHLLLGDETAAPAIAAILDSTPDDALIDALIETPTPDHLVDSGGDARITVLVRGDDTPGAAMAAALEEAALPAYDFAWIGGERGMVKRSRRLLVEQGTDKKSIAFASYWILGRPRP